FCYKCVLQILPGPCDDIRRPDKIVATGDDEIRGLQHRCLGLRQMFIDRDDLTPPTSLERSGAVIFIEQEILQRSQQERAKPTLLPIRAAQCVLLKQMSEETLDEILCISGWMTAVAKKTVKR